MVESSSTRRRSSARPLQRESLCWFNNALDAGWRLARAPIDDAAWVPAVSRRRCGWPPALALRRDPDRDERAGAAQQDAALAPVVDGLPGHALAARLGLRRRLNRGHVDSGQRDQRYHQQEQSPTHDLSPYGCSESLRQRGKRAWRRRSTDP